MNSEKQSFIYGLRLAVIYSIVWFIDLLDASSLNVALPAIAQNFNLAAVQIEWAIMGFLLAMAIGITVSSWLGERFGMRSIFLASQLIYIAGSLGCGFAPNLSVLTVFRIIQGFAAGIAIPLGLSTLLKVMPQNYWAKTTAYMNIVSLIAPAMGPVFSAYSTSLFGWRSIFFLKLPLSLICLFLTFIWVQKEDQKSKTKFDWIGFILGSLSLSCILWVFSEVGKQDQRLLFAAFFASLLMGFLFLIREKKCSIPLIPLTIFKFNNFSFGNLIQSAANTIFLGANFLIALYLQAGVGLDLVATGWVMAAITPGMIIVQPLVGKFYNKLGPLPFIIPGLIMLALCTYAFAFTSSGTSPLFFGFLVFCIGAASAITQSSNVTSIFSSLPHQYKGAGSSVYSLLKQVSASFGVALSTMMLTMAAGPVETYTADVFYNCFFALGSIPALALFCCFFINNRSALSQVNG